ALTEHKETEAQLRREVGQTQKKLQTQQGSSGTGQNKLQARIKELQGAHSAVEQKGNALTETLTQETKTPGSAERQANEVGKHHSELETELARNTEAQAKLREELETSQKQLQAQQQSSRAEQSQLASQVKELQTAHTAVEQRVASLTDQLAQE